MIGAPQAVVDGVGNVRLARYVPPGAERVVALGGNSEIVGYAYLVSREQAVLHEPLFCTSFGMRPYRHEQLYEKEIRPGRELRRLTR